MKKLSLLLACLLTFVGAFTASSARADIMVSPIYVIMDDRDRSAEVNLINTSSKTAIYRLEWSYTRQKSDGSYEKLAKLPDGAIDPAKFLRFSPRQVTLPGQGKQKVRIQLQKPADLPNGEYRLHLNFVRLPDDSNTIGDGNKVDGVSMQLKVFLGISMPIVVRQGGYDARAEIVDVGFEKPKRRPHDKKDPAPELRVGVKREGIHGTYGRLRVFWDNGGNSEQIGLLNNFSIYADNPERVGHVPLTVTSVPSGALRVVYEGDGPQRGQIFAEQIVNIGK